MDKENELKPGDMVQHKATGMFCVVLEVKNREITVRRKDDYKKEYFDFELSKVSDDIMKDRLEHFKIYEDDIDKYRQNSGKAGD